MRASLPLLLALTACASQDAKITGQAPAPIEQGRPSRASPRGATRDLRAAVAEIAAEAERRIVVAPGIDESVSIDIAGLPWRSAIKMVALEARCAIDEIAGGALVLTRAPFPTPLGGATLVRAQDPERALGSSRGVDAAGGPMLTTLIRLENVSWAKHCASILSPPAAHWGAFPIPKYLPQDLQGWPLFQALRQVVDARPADNYAVQYDIDSHAILIRADPATTQNLRAIIEAADRLPTPLDLTAIRWPLPSQVGTCLINGHVLARGQAVHDRSGAEVPGLVFIGAGRGRACFRTDDGFYVQALPGLGP